MIRTLLPLVIIAFLSVFWQKDISLAQLSVAASPADSIWGSSPGSFIALSVANLERVVTWYCDTLGFHVFSIDTISNKTIRFALLQHGNALIEFLQSLDAKPRVQVAPQTTDSYQIHGFFKSGFVIQDIDAAYHHMQSLGVNFEYKLIHPPNGPYRSFGLRDPEGNLLQFFGK